MAARILLALEWYDHRLHRGVATVARRLGWHLSCTIGRPGADPIPAGWHGDGAVTLLSDPVLQRRISRRCPAIVDVGLATTWRVPRLAVDNDAVGRLAVEHFRTRGYRHFATLGAPGIPMFQERIAAFARHAGSAVTTLTVPRRTTWEAQIAALGRQLARLPEPVGVFAAQDLLAIDILAAAEAAGLAVPGRIAVLGVDDVELLCTTQAIPLASIDTDQEGLGAAAAERLAGLLAGSRDDGALRRWSPRQVVVRASAEALGSADPALRRALALARKDPACGVRALATAAGLSAQALDRRMRSELGLNPGILLRRLRLERARAALTAGATLAIAAQAAGIADARGLCAATRRAFNATPGQIRSAARDRTH